MDYDPTMRALFFPGKDAPVADFSTAWPRDALCAELSRLAYVAFEKDEAQRLHHILDAAGFGARKTFHSARTGAQGFGAVAGDTAYVALRGTQITSPLDLIADALAIPVRWAGEGRVDWGFWNAFRSIRAEIDAWLAGVAHSRLVTTGHSLGAAMATLMAALHGEAELVTFGSPRVGTRAFTARFGADRIVRRYVDCVDTVPKLPPPLGYTHLGEMIYIDGKGRLHDPPPDAVALKADRRAAKRAFRRAFGVRFHNVLFRSGADHAPVNYVSAVSGRRDGP